MRRKDSQKRATIGTASILQKATKFTDSTPFLETIRELNLHVVFKQRVFKQVNIWHIFFSYFLRI